MLCNNSPSPKYSIQEEKIKDKRRKCVTKLVSCMNLRMCVANDPKLA